MNAWAQWQYRMDTICTPETQGKSTCERLGRMEKIADAEWVVMAREAFLLQMEFGWTAERIFNGPWQGAWKVVVTDGITDGEEWNAWCEYSQNRFPDPVAALSAAYRWKRKRAVPS